MFFYCWNWPEGHLSQEKLKKIEINFVMKFTSNPSRTFKTDAIKIFMIKFSISSFYYVQFDLKKIELTQSISLNSTDQ